MRTSPFCVGIRQRAPITIAAIGKVGASPYSVWAAPCLRRTPKAVKTVRRPMRARPIPFPLSGITWVRLPTATPTTGRRVPIRSVPVSHLHQAAVRWTRHRLSCIRSRRSRMRCNWYYQRQRPDQGQSDDAQFSLLPHRAAFDTHPIMVQRRSFVLQGAIAAARSERMGWPSSTSEMYEVSLAFARPASIGARRDPAGKRGSGSPARGSRRHWTRSGLALPSPKRFS